MRYDDEFLPPVAACGDTPRDRLVRSNQGGPIRTVLNGRQMKPTGTFISVKAGYRALVWESKKAELACMRLCEVSPQVFGMMSQPHRFEFQVSRLAQPLIYFPDFELDVSKQLIRDLDNGMPFCEAALKVRRSQVRVTHQKKLVLEIKAKGDPRLDDPFYNEKLRLAGLRYAAIGYHFVILHKERDIDSKRTSVVHEVSLDNRTAVGSREIASVRQMLETSGGMAHYADLVAVLGGGPVGRAKLHAMHVKQIVCLELQGPLADRTKVHLISR